MPTSSYSCYFLLVSSLVPSVITKHTLHVRTQIIDDGRSIRFYPQQEVPDVDKFVVLNFVRTISDPDAFLPFDSDTSV